MIMFVLPFSVTMKRIQTNQRLLPKRFKPEINSKNYTHSYRISSWSIDIMVLSVDIATRRKWMRSRFCEAESIIRVVDDELCELIGFIRNVFCYTAFALFAVQNVNGRTL